MNDHLKVAVQSEKEKQITQRDYSIYSPVMQEYFKIKDEYPDTIILFQIGYFYEAMGDDTITVSQALSLHNTTRRINDTERIDMCGFPSHRLETYTDMLLDLGYNIGISSPNDRQSRDFILMASDRSHAPIQSEPIGRIDYPNADGEVENSIEYTNPTSLERNIKEENTFDVRMAVYLYKDADGNTIPPRLY